MDDVPVSGVISGQWNYSSPSGGVSIDLELDDFKMDDRSTDGDILLEADISEKAEVAIDADLSITDPEGQTETLSVDNLTVAADFNSTYLNPEDDQYTMNGTGQYSDSEGNAYTLIFTDMVSTFLCFFPVSGKLKVVSTTPSYTATVDFGSGGCDTQATITIGKLTHEVDLSEPVNL